MFPIWLNPHEVRCFLNERMVILKFSTLKTAKLISGTSMFIVRTCLQVSGERFELETKIRS